MYDAKWEAVRRGDVEMGFEDFGGVFGKCQWR